MARYSMDGFDPNTDLNWEFKKDDTVVFKTVQSDLVQYNGMTCTILRRLTENDAHLCEVGPMYHVCVGPWWADEKKRIEIDCFQDELTATSETMFCRMVDTYRALGYRMVVFEPADEGDGTSSWLCAYDTHGVNANNLPIEAFANECWMDNLRGYASYRGPVSEVWHEDVTDDMGEMLGGYDWTANYPVQQLVNC